MRFKIRNVKDKKSYNVEVECETEIKDENKVKKIRHRRLDENPICPECNKPISECQCKKDEEIHDKKDSEEEKDEKSEEKEIEISKEEFEQLEELIKLLPDLKKLLGENSKKDPEEGEKKKNKKAKSESEEEEKEEEMNFSKGDELDPNIILEESDDKEPLPEDYDIEEEEDVIEDEGGCNVSDSINPGVVEKVSDSNKDTVSREIEVAETWESRYKQLLNHK